MISELDLPDQKAVLILDAFKAQSMDSETENVYYWS